MASKVFISWGGDLSKKLAEELKNWLPSVLQFVKPYFTPEDIEKGTRWESNIANELSTSNVGLICLTKDNINRPWILFEAGALSKNLDKANVCTILFNIDSSEITGPLTCFQATKFDKSDFKKLIKTINNTGGELKLDPTILDTVFEMWWPKLEEKINTIIHNYKGETHKEDRSDRELLEEVLNLTRIYVKQVPQKFQNQEMRHSLIQLLDAIKHLQIYSLNNKELEPIIQQQIYPAIEILCMELGVPSIFKRYLIQRDEITHMTR